MKVLEKYQDLAVGLLFPLIIILSDSSAFLSVKAWDIFILCTDHFSDVYISQMKCVPFAFRIKAAQNIEHYLPK